MVCSTMSRNVLIRGTVRAMSETRTQDTEMRLAREKWWNALSRQGDPLHLTNLFKAFNAGYDAGKAASETGYRCTACGGLDHQCMSSTGTPPLTAPAATPGQCPTQLLSPQMFAQKLANCSGIDRWSKYLQEWLDSYIDRWKQEDVIWRTEVERLREALRQLHDELPMGGLTSTTEIRRRLEALAGESAPETTPAPPQELEAALNCIVDRYEREDKGGMATRPGLAWAMYTDAKAGLEGRFLPKAASSETPRGETPEKESR